MTIQEVIDAVLRYHPHLEGHCGCDEFKCGNPADECTGVAVAMSPTIRVVEQAIQQHCNLIIVHEPTNYTSLDCPGWREDFLNEVYARKQALLQEHGIAIWRDHDHMHAHNPDGIFNGVLRYMGWEDYAVPDPSMKMFMHFIVTLPAPQRLGEILAQLRDTIGLNGIRYIGDEAMTIRKLAIVGHLNTRPEPGPGAEVNHHGDMKSRESIWFCRVTPSTGPCRPTSATPYSWGRIQRSSPSATSTGKSSACGIRLTGCRK